MNHARTAARTDANQTQVVKALRQIPGVSVSTGHDDLLVGYRGVTLWVEVKRAECYDRKTGALKERFKKPSQVALDATWTGARIYAKSAEDVLRWFGLIK